MAQKRRVLEFPNLSIVFLSNLWWEQIMGGAGQCMGTNKQLSCGVGECKVGL